MQIKFDKLRAQLWFWQKKKEKNISKKIKKVVDFKKKIWYITNAHLKKCNDLWKLSKTSITLSQGKIKYEIKLDKFLESLILAQDERWRHA